MKNTRGLTASLPLILLLCLLPPGGVALAQHKVDLKSIDDTKRVCEIFFERLRKVDMKSALGTIRPYVAISENDFKSIAEETGRQREELVKRFGNPISCELLQEQRIKDTLVKYTYLEKCKIHVIRWSFIFYKPEDKWILNSFYWDDNIREIFR
jgi:hypothetical protein